MNITWNEYEKYDDGSQETCARGVFTICGKDYSVRIDDHTLPLAKKDDKRIGRAVPHAYVVYDSDDIIKSSAMRELGFEPSHGINSMGIDRNPGYIDKTSRHEYIGIPEHTIRDVEKLVEKAVIESFQFDYDAELKKVIDNLNMKKAQMDEVNAYQSAL